MARDCDPNFVRVDEILDLLTKSKSLHILLISDNKKLLCDFQKSSPKWSHHLQQYLEDLRNWRMPI